MALDFKYSVEIESKTFPYVNIDINPWALEHNITYLWVLTKNGTYEYSFLTEQNALFFKLRWQ